MNTDFVAEFFKMWHIKATAVFVIVGTLGMIKKGVNKHINRIPGSHGQYEIPPPKKKLCAKLIIFLGE